MIKIIYNLLFICLLLVTSSLKTYSTEPAHNSVIILIDASGSMKQSDPLCLRRDAVKLFLNLLPDGDNVSFAEFGDGVRDLTNGFLKLDKETKHTISLLAQKCSAKDKYTDILQALTYVNNLVSSQPLEVRRAFPPSVIFLTDGIDDVPAMEGRLPNIKRKINELSSLGVVVNTVGFSKTADVSLLKNIADATGGYFCPIETANDLIRGFFELSRVLGKRWALEEKEVKGGPFRLSIPSWAGKLMFFYLPNRPTFGNLSTSGVTLNFIREERYQLLVTERLGAGPLSLTIPEIGGKILLDTEAEMTLQAQVGRKVPARIPFCYLVRLVPGRLGELGQPLFLGQMALFLRLDPRLGLEPTPLYDDGQHEDGKALDGLFGGYPVITQPGKWPFQLVARARFSPALTQSGQLEAIYPPISVHPPGIWGRYVSVHWQKGLPWAVFNLTEVPIKGVFIAKVPGHAQQEMPFDLSGGKSQQLTIKIQPYFFQTNLIAMQVKLDGLQEPLEYGIVVVPPQLTALSILVSFVFFLALSFIFPRRRIKRLLLVVGEREGHEFSGTLRISRNGRVEPSDDLPDPFYNPGTFLARSGIWRKGIIFVPAYWCHPSFKMNIPTRLGKGYLIKRTVSWTCQTPDGRAEYTLRS